MRVSLRALLALTVWAGVARAQSANSSCTNVEGTIYGYELDVMSLDPERFSLEEYRGKVLVIFNSATYWGLYMQYVDWNAIKKEFNTELFDVLAVPSNHFSLQEPGGNDNILDGLEHVRPGSGFVANYTVAGKSNINGASQEDLYTYLKGSCPGTTETIGETAGFYWTPIRQADITWNFEKFLISAEGKPVRRYNPGTSPYDLRDDIQEQLDAISKKEEVKDVRKAKILQGLAKKRSNKTPTH